MIILRNIFQKSTSIKNIFNRINVKEALMIYISKQLYQKFGQIKKYHSYTTTRVSISS